MECYHTAWCMYSNNCIQILIFYHNHDLPCVLIQSFLSYRALSILSPRDWVRSTTAKALMFRLEYMTLWFVTCCVLGSLCTHLMLMGGGGGGGGVTLHSHLYFFLPSARYQGQDLDPSNFCAWSPHPSSTCMKRLRQFLSYTKSHWLTAWPYHLTLVMDVWEYSSPLSLLMMSIYTNSLGLHSVLEGRHHLEYHTPRNSKSL